VDALGDLTRFKLAQRRVLQWMFMAVASIGAYSPARSNPDLEQFGLLLEPRVVAGAFLLALGTLSFLSREGPMRATIEQWLWWAGFIAVHLLILVSSTWSMDPWMVEPQIKDLLLLATYVVVFMQLFGREPEVAVRMLFIASIILSFPFLALVLLGGFGEESGNAGGIGMARLFGLASIAGAYFHYTRGSKFALFMLPILAAGIMLSGSRAALLALVFAFAYLFMRRGQLKRKDDGRWGIKLLGIFAVLACVVGFFLTPFGLTILEGFIVSNIAPAARAPGAPEAIYLADRDVIFQDALMQIVDHPLLGLGMGSYRGPFGEEYPHNLLLLYGTDAGVGTMLILMGFMAHFLWRALRSRCDWAIGAAAAGLFLLVAAMFAGSYYDARVFWFMALLLASPAARGQGNRAGVGEHMALVPAAAGRVQPSMR
jgi:hypothetical protein